MDCSTRVRYCRKITSFHRTRIVIKKLSSERKNKKKVADKCGYIVWKDRKEVVFYTNNLIDTPTKDFLHSAKETDSEEAIRCVGGLEYVERWDEECRNIRKLFLCPVFIALYNLFMNGVDCVDQRI